MVQDFLNSCSSFLSEIGQQSLWYMQKLDNKILLACTVTCPYKVSWSNFHHKMIISSTQHLFHMSDGFAHWDITVNGFIGLSWCQTEYIKITLFPYFTASLRWFPFLIPLSTTAWVGSHGWPSHNIQPSSKQLSLTLMNFVNLKKNAVPLDRSYPSKLIIGIKQLKQHLKLQKGCKAHIFCF